MTADTTANPTPSTAVAWTALPPTADPCDVSVLVAPTKYVSAAKGIDDAKAPRLVRMSLSDALGTPFEDDAHLIGYDLFGISTDDQGQPPPIPRISKVSLAVMQRQLAEMGGGEETGFFTNLICLDIDNANHEPWDRESLARFRESLESACGQSPDIIGSWTAKYFTRAGARLVYVFDKPVPVERSEAFTGGLIREARRVGLPADLLCDWTRLFRLPFVTRDREPSWVNEHDIPDLVFRDVRLSIEACPTLGQGDTAQAYAEIEPLNADVPDFDYCRDLIETIGGNNQRIVLTPWAKDAKKQLKGRECYAYL
ncbi:MAG: hypothetical protein AAF085_13825, partial [Planctomycetota bacterium]